MDPSPFALHLNTNYIPTSPEIDSIRGLIDAQKLAVDAIDKRLADLDRLRMELEAERSIHTEFIDEHYALTTIARTLPEDILSTLFTTLLSLTAPMTSPSPSVVVSHVCRRWRSITLGMPVLWADIEAWIPTPTSDQDDWESRWAFGLGAMSDRIHTFIARSASYPLALRLHVQDLNDGIFVKIATTIKREDSPFNLFCHALVPCASKAWRNMHLHHRQSPVG